MLIQKIYPLILAAALSACAGTRAADVRKLARDGEVEQMLTIWDEAKKTSVQVAVLQGFAQHHPGDPSGRALVIEAARSPDNELRLAAIRALAAYEGNDVLQILLDSLADSQPSARSLAKQELSKRGEKAEQLLVTAATGHPNYLVRATATELLVQNARRNDRLKRQLGQILQDSAQRDEAPSVRQAAVMGLGTLSVNSSRSILMELMRTDGDASVRMSAERAISKLSPGEAVAVPVVAILPLKDDTGANDPEIKRLGQQIADYAAAKLSGSKFCQVVDKKKTDHALQELKKHGKLLYDGDAPNAPEIGKFKLANQLIFGSIQKQGLVYTIVLQRMDVSTLALVPGASATASGYKNELDQLKQEVVERFLVKFR